MNLKYSGCWVDKIELFVKSKNIWVPKPYQLIKLILYKFSYYFVFNYFPAVKTILSFIN